MPFDIDSFSRYLCFMLPHKITLPPELDSKSFQIGVDPENLSFVIDQLYKMYEPGFKAVIELMKESRTHTDTFFMKKVISRCVKLSENAKTYSHFMLVCALIEGIVKDHLDTVHCFYYPSLCYYCLISVYNRCYKEYFGGKEELDDTLDSFITNLRELLSIQNSLEDMRNLPIFSENNIGTVLENLIHVEYQDFPLTEYEQESLEDLPALLPIIQPSAGNQPVYKSSESISECSSCRRILAEDATESISECSSCRRILAEDATESISECSSCRRILAEDATESISECSSCRGIAAEDATECESIDEDSTSKPSESESVYSGINMDVLPSESNDADCSDMTSFSSESKSSSSCKDSIGVPKSVSMDSDTTSKSTASSTDINTSNMERDDVAMRAEWEYYRERICDFCSSRCAVLPVNYITKTLESQISQGENE